MLRCAFLLSFVNRTNRAKLDLTGGVIVAPRSALPEAGRRAEAPLMEAKACREYAKEMRNRYRKAVRAQRGRLLDEFTAVTGYHRKYAIGLLGREPMPRSRPPGKPTRFTDRSVRSTREDLARCRLSLVCAVGGDAADVDAARAHSPRSL